MREEVHRFDDLTIHGFRSNSRQNFAEQPCAMRVAGGSPTHKSIEYRRKRITHFGGVQCRFSSYSAARDAG
ncbi:hypothetical protein GGD55_003835 [Rhizobium giardinii]|uniref:Uncharacterized protein n=1 Tax=Rhizobium giardinii TaxID=56731 RepID=A0A7W8UFB4_9HYPH|nr:hypothetical protein [Rhizobium giardinii]